MIFIGIKSQKYMVRQKLAITYDHLPENRKKRDEGAFYTPAVFAEYAHKLLENKFGSDWKDRYVVWDNCCGTKNLTKGHAFKELYCSTLEDSELVEGAEFNPEATSFRFDFLNDPLDDLPAGLLSAFKENRPIIFFINPPYATSSSFIPRKQKTAGVASTMISKMMSEDNLSLACKSMVPQFLYRIVKIKEEYGLTDVHIAIFCNPNFLCANSFSRFREMFLDNFKFDGGIYFNASEFSDVSNKWGIAFEFWDAGVQEERTSFVHKVVKNDNGTIVEQFDKSIYNVDGLTDTSKWVREIPVSPVKVDLPVMKTGIVPYDNPSGKKIWQLTEDAIGCYYHIASDVCNSPTYVALFTANCSHPSGKWSITKENLKRVTATFAARKLTLLRWYNDKDVFVKPNVDHPKYKEFENDSLVYSLFHTNSNQSSLRNVEYNGKKWDIKNEFFFFSRKEMENLSLKTGNQTCLKDLEGDTERYMYEVLEGTELSPEAREVLEKARELVRKTFRYRQEFDAKHPEYQINNWDCGWHQLKALFAEYDPEGYKDFDESVKRLWVKMRPMVHELGFLF